MLSKIQSIFALLLSFGILCLGHGLNNTVLGVRADIEGYSDIVTGFIMTGYYIGFIFGTTISAKLIPNIGQIRVFAVFASIASVVSLFHVLFLNEYLWILFRLLYGMCMASLYMVIESWLNKLCDTKNRGRILSIYMSVHFLTLSLGQTFIFLAEPNEYILFAVVSILISFSLIPITLTRTEQPKVVAGKKFGFKKLMSISPLGTLGCIFIGMSLGAFWGLGAVYFASIGIEPKDIAVYMFLIFLGGFMFQWPIGYLSDTISRRITILFVVSCSIIMLFVMLFVLKNMDGGINIILAIALISFGGSLYTLYSLFIALVNDYLSSEHFVMASGGLLSLHAIGSIFGPLLGSVMMSIIGSNGLFIFIIIVNSIILFLAIYRTIIGKKIPKENISNFVSIPKTSVNVIGLDPRRED